MDVAQAEPMWRARPRSDDVHQLASVVLREIAADEAAARAAADVGNDACWTWRDDRTGSVLREPFDGEWLGDVDTEPSLYAVPAEPGDPYTQLLDADGDVPAAVGTHIARFDPAKILRECAHKRLLIGLLVSDVDEESALSMLRDLAGASAAPSATESATRAAAPPRPGALPDPDWLPYPQRSGERAS